MFFFSSRRRHTRLVSDWSSDVCSSDLRRVALEFGHHRLLAENIADQPGRTMVVEVAAVESDDAGGFLAAMLKGVRSEERRVGKECRLRGWRLAGRDNR